MKPLITLISEDISSGSLKLPSAPTVVVKVNELIRDENVSLSKLADVFTGHPAVVAKILQVVNSPALRPSRAITSVTEAINFLGISLVKNLALAVCLKSAFKSKNPNLQTLLTAEWSRSLTVAAMSAMLAKHLGANSNTALVAGLLYNIGSLPILRYMEEHKVDSSEFPKISSILSKKASLYMLKSWGIPDEISQTILHKGIAGEVLLFIQSYLDKQPYPGALNISVSEFEELANAHKAELNNLLSVLN